MPNEELFETLGEELKNQIRVRRSLREELEAIDLYDERIAQTKDKELKRILEHNRDEEKEHVAMLMEWLRKHDAEQDAAFRQHD